MQQGYLLDGGYELVEIIGSGGMATVYRGLEKRLNRDVAIKVMSPHLAADPDYVQRFNREAQTVATLQHPGIIQIYYYSVDVMGSFVVMPLLKGGTLMDRMKQSQELIAIREAGDLALKIGGVLHYAHNEGIVHRDIKFSNIMFDSTGNPYVMDFGIARMLNSTQLTATGGHVGTPQFMAPEQWRGDVSPSVDQYALAVVLYELLGGQPPFDGESSHALMYQHLESIPPPITTHRADVPAQVAEVLTRALDKDVEKRYPDMESFSQAFHTACQNAAQQSTGFFTFKLKPSVVKPLNTTPNVMLYTPVPHAVAPEGIPKPDSIVSPLASQLIVQKKSSLNLWIPALVMLVIIIFIAVAFVLNQQTTRGLLIQLTNQVIESDRQNTVAQLSAEETSEVEPTVTRIDGTSNVVNPTETVRFTAIPSDTTTPTLTLVPTLTPTDNPTATITASATATLTNTPTATITASSTVTLTNTPTATVTAPPTVTRRVSILATAPGGSGLLGSRVSSQSDATFVPIQATSAGMGASLGQARPQATSPGNTATATITASATATLTNTPTPTSVPVAQACEIRATGRVPIHVGPDTGRAIRGSLARDIWIEVTGQRHGDDNNLWWRVYPPDAVASEADRYWVLQDDTQERGDCDLVEDVEASSVIAANTSQSNITGESFQIDDSIALNGFDEWTFDGNSGDLVTISLNSGDFDTYLEIRYNGRIVVQDDDGGSGLNSRISAYSLPDSGTYTIRVRSFSNSGGGNYTLNFSSTPSSSTISSSSTTSAINLNISDSIAYSGFDEWTFAGNRGDLVTISLNSGDFDTYLEIRYNGQIIVQNDDGGAGLNSQISAYSLPNSGTYTVRVRSFSNGGGGNYSLTVSGS